MNDTPNGTIDAGEQPRRHDPDRADIAPPVPMPAETRSEPRAAPSAPHPEGAGRISPPRNLAPLPGMNETPQARRRSSPVLGCLTGLALLLALLSLALGVYLLFVLSSIQQAAIDEIDAAILALDDLRGAEFHYEYQFQQDVPVVARFPIEQQITIPFEGNFPINTTIEVPIDAGMLGTFAIDVPIDTNVYVNTEVPIKIDQTFTVNTSIPISMTVPIDVGADAPEIQGVVTRMQEWLIDLRDSLSHGLVPAWLAIEN